MGRTASPETQLRSAKAEIKDLEAQLTVMRRSRDEYHSRTTKAEQECKEWKERFDLLLKRTPESLK